MIPELAFYHKLMLQAGATDRYEQYIDQTLEKTEQPGDLLLDLACCLSDLNQTISLLYQYTLAHPVDMDAVASLVWEDLHRRYVEKQHPLPELREIMYRIAESSGCRFGEPWYTMGFFELCWDEVEMGLLNRDEFLKSMESFLLNRTTITDEWIYKPQQTEVSQ